MLFLSTAFSFKEEGEKKFMAKFCGKCGEKLDETTGLCPKCDMEKSKEKFNQNQLEEMEDIKSVKNTRKRERRAKKKVDKKENYAHWSKSKKIRRFFLKFILVILCLTVLVGVLVYFDVVDIPIIENNIIQLKNDSHNSKNFSQFQSFSVGFTDKKIIDQESALQAINDVSEIIGIDNVEKELGDCEENNVLGNIYYKFQQKYKNIPVYGRSIIIEADENGKAMMLSGNYMAVGDITISPSISEEDIKLSIEQYINNFLEITNVENIFFEEISNSNLCIYNLETDGQSYLAYDLAVNFSSDKISQYQFIVNALTGEILCATPTIYTENATGYLFSDSYCENGFNIRKEKNGKYILADDSRQLIVKTFNGAVSQYLITNNNNEKEEKFDEEPAKVIYSDDNIWGNTEVEKAFNCEIGATLLMNVGVIFDYYKNELGFDAKIPVTLYYDDGYDNGNNALGGIIDDYGIISMGKNKSPSDIDIVAHEYTHVISRKIVNWAEGYETGVLNEAISDVMGEIIEAVIQKKQVDWKISTRDIINYDKNTYTTEYCYYEYNGEDCPIKEKFGTHIHNDNYTKTKISCWVRETLKYPSSYKGENWIDNNDSHINSILISHAAYLMWTGIGGNPAFEALSTQDIAQLFYTTLYALPSDCTFSQFRTLLQNTADIMYEQGRLSDGQRFCVSNAMFQVGISLAPVSYTVSQNFELSVYDINGKLYNDYSVKISELDLVNIPQGPRIKANKKEVATYSSNISKALAISIDYGIYEMIITDNANELDVYTVYIKVIPKGKKILNLNTIFGTFDKSITDDLSDDETDKKDYTIASEWLGKTLGEYAEFVEYDYIEDYLGDLGKCFGSSDMSEPVVISSECSFQLDDSFMAEAVIDLVVIGENTKSPWLTENIYIGMSVDDLIAELEAMNISYSRDDSEYYQMEWGSDYVFNANDGNMTYFFSIVNEQLNLAYIWEKDADETLDYNAMADIVLANEEMLGSENSMGVKNIPGIRTADFNFDGIPELIVESSGGSMGNCPCAVYSIQISGLENLGGYDTGNLQLYYDESTGEKVFIGTMHHMDGVAYYEDHVFELSYQDDRIYLCEIMYTVSDDRNYTGNPEFSYFINTNQEFWDSDNMYGQVSQNFKQVSEEEYNEFYDSYYSNLKNLNMSKDFISFSDWNMMDQATKKERLVELFENYRYDEP